MIFINFAKKTRKCQQDQSFRVHEFIDHASKLKSKFTLEYFSETILACVLYCKWPWKKVLPKKGRNGMEPERSEKCDAKCQKC